MKTLFSLALLLLIPSLLAGCGFRPIYGSQSANGESSVAMELNNIAIDNIPDRDGQMLRNDLIDHLYGKNRPSKPAYVLKITVRSTEEDLGILANATATRSLIDMYGDYSLLDAKGKVLLKGTAHSVASFDKLDQIFSTVAARQDAHQRTLNEMSEQIVNRLSLFFSERK
jgi:LPS-assembly lipoprotein